jgi:hypothetical protein
VGLSWAAATDDVGVAGYRVYRDDVLVANTPSLAWTDTAQLPGSTHKYRVTAFDAVGNSTQSNIVYDTVAAPPPAGGGGDNGSGGNGNPQPPADKTAPVVRVTSPGKRARLRRRAVIAARASDNVGVVRMELSIDGTQLAVSSSTRIKRTWSLRYVRPGNHLIMVRAYDAQGNFATRIVRVRVLKPHKG